MEATGREKQIIDERIKKISEFRKEGVNPYPHRLDEFAKKELGHWTIPQHKFL